MRDHGEFPECGRDSATGRTGATKTILDRETWSEL
jgi:hypothetical protein